MKNGLSHPYHLDESTFTVREIRSIYSIFISFFDGFLVSKQNSPRWDTAFCGVTSGAFLFAYVPQNTQYGCKHGDLQMKNCDIIISYIRVFFRITL